MFSAGELSFLLSGCWVLCSNDSALYAKNDYPMSVVIPEGGGGGPDLPFLDCLKMSVSDIQVGALPY